MAPEAAPQERFTALDEIATPDKVPGAPGTVGGGDGEADGEGDGEAVGVPGVARPVRSLSCRQPGQRNEVVVTGPNSQRYMRPE